MVTQCRYTPGARWRSGREFIVNLSAHDDDILGTIIVQINDIYGDCESAYLNMSAHSAMVFVAELMCEIGRLGFEDKELERLLTAAERRLAPRVFDFPGGNDAA